MFLRIKLPSDCIQIKFRFKWKPWPLCYGCRSLPLPRYDTYALNSRWVSLTSHKMWVQQNSVLTGHQKGSMQKSCREWWLYVLHASLLIFMLHCHPGLQQQTSLKIKSLKTSAAAEHSTQYGALWEQGPAWLHGSQSHETVPVFNPSKSEVKFSIFKLSKWHLKMSNRNNALFTIISLN